MNRRRWPLAICLLLVPVVPAVADGAVWVRDVDCVAGDELQAAIQEIFDATVACGASRAADEGSDEVNDEGSDESVCPGAPPQVRFSIRGTCIANFGVPRLQSWTFVGEDPEISVIEGQADGNATQDVISVDDGARLEVRNLTLRRGASGISARRAVVVLSNVRVADNQIGLLGERASWSIDNSLVANNAFSGINVSGGRLDLFFSVVADNGPSPSTGLGVSLIEGAQGFIEGTEIRGHASAVTAQGQSYVQLLEVDLQSASLELFATGDGFISAVSCTLTEDIVAQRGGTIETFSSSVGGDGSANLFGRLLFFGTDVSGTVFCGQTSDTVCAEGTTVGGVFNCASCSAGPAVPEEQAPPPPVLPQAPLERGSPGRSRPIAR